MLRNPINRDILINGDMSKALVSSPFDLNGNEGYAVQASWSGLTGSGQLYLQASCYADQSRWTQIKSSAFTVNTADGDDLWNVGVAKYRWGQLVWVPDIGGATGVLKAVVNIK